MIEVTSPDYVPEVPVDVPFTPEPPVVQPDAPDTAPEPPTVAPAFEDLLKEKFGVGPDELSARLKEFEDMKNIQIPDDEIIPDTDFLKDLVRYAKTTGKLDPYLEAKGVDFTKMPDEDVLRRALNNSEELRNASPDFKKREVERKLTEMKAKWGFDEDASESDLADANERMRLAASSERERLMAEQAKFVMPEREAKKNEAFDEKAYAKIVEDFRNEPSVSQFVASKKVKAGDFNFDVSDPERSLASALDNEVFHQNFKTKDGGVDLEKFFLIDTIARDPERFLAEFSKHEIAKAKVEWLKEIKNPSTPTTKGDAPPAVQFL